MSRRKREPARNGQEASERAEHGRRVRAARSWADITQEDLADALGFSLATIKRTERGERRVPTNELIAIADACDIPPWFMLHGLTPQAPTLTASGAPALAEDRFIELADERDARLLAAADAFVTSLRQALHTA